MQVILLKDVKNVGKKDQTVNVSDGFANNYLFKNKLAVPLTKKSAEILGNQQEDARIAEENRKKAAQELAEKLKEITLEFTLSVGKDNRPFGSISLKQVEEELKKQGINIDKRKILDARNLSELGIHILKIELHKGVVGEIKVHISERK